MKTKTIWISMLILLSGQCMYCQLRFDQVVVNPKIGIYSTFKESGGIVGGMEINTSYEKWMFSLDYYYLGEFAFLFYETPVEHYNQIGLMGGTYVGERLLRCQIMGGVAPFWGLRRTELLKPHQFLTGAEYASDKFLTLGLVLKLGLKINLSDYVGIGVDIQTNINGKNSFWMPMLSLEFGQIRE